MKIFAKRPRDKLGLTTEQKASSLIKRRLFCYTATAGNVVAGRIL